MWDVSQLSDVGNLVEEAGIHGDRMQQKRKSKFGWEVKSPVLDMLSLLCLRNLCVGFGTYRSEAQERGGSWK